MSESDASPAREQTDESLRVEREKTDIALDDKLDAIDEMADALITRARARADAVLALARARIDRGAGSPPPRTERERRREDDAVQEERAEADETVRVERAELAGSLAAERAVTDNDLTSERAVCDDALATRDTFLGMVSHELRNMLGTVIGYAAHLASVEPREEYVDQVRQHARVIQRASVHMDRLVGDLIDVASIAAGSLKVSCEVGHPTLVVLEAVESFQAQASAKGITLDTHILGGGGAVTASFDPARILQVLTNLLLNAFKFTPANGRIAVGIDGTGAEILFSISDTGAGIPADQLECVFERFFQVSPDRRGAGLGLYISKCIVNGHGGRMWAESELGHGSTFYFTLPALAIQRA